MIVNALSVCPFSSSHRRQTHKHTPTKKNVCSGDLSDYVIA